MNKERDTEEMNFSQKPNMWWLPAAVLSLNLETFS